jgi:hypothetical protein
MLLSEAPSHLAQALDRAGFDPAAPRVGAAVEGFMAFAREPVELDEDPSAAVFDRTVVEIDPSSPPALPWHEPREPTVQLAFARHVRPLGEDGDHEEIGLIVSFAAADVPGTLGAREWHCDDAGRGFAPGNPDDRGGLPSLDAVAEALTASREYEALSGLTPVGSETYG